MDTVFPTLLRQSPRYRKGWRESWKDAKWNRKKPNFWKISNLQLLMTIMKSVLVKLSLLSILSMLVILCRLVMLWMLVMLSMSVMLSMLVMLCRLVMLSMLVMILLMILLMTKWWKKRNISIYLISLKSLLSSLKTILYTFLIWIWGNLSKV